MLHAESTPASPAACASLPHDSPYRTNCLQQFNESKRRDLEAVLRACKWQRLEFKPTRAGCNSRRANLAWSNPCSGSDGGAEILHGVTEGTMRPLAVSRPGWLVSGGGVRVERCGHVGDGREWEVHRVGPFTTTGGNDWTRVLLPALHSRHAPGTRLAVSEYFVGSTSTDGELLPYPALHQHHFHAEEHKADWFAGGLIGHGDDQCLASSGGVACLVRRHAPGHVQWVTTPLSVDCEVNDVRAAGSAPLTHWATVALKSIRHAAPPEPSVDSRGAGLQALTQIRLTVMPLNVRHPGYPGTYGVPSNQTSAFFREGTFLVDTPPLAWSYFHTHGHYVDEMALYINTSARSLGLVDAGLSSGLRVFSTKVGLGLRDWAAKHAAARGARRVCHYKRASDLSERSFGTEEIDGVFYRKAAGCVPFEIARGLPFVAVVFASPDSSAAASLAPDGIAPLHTFFRLFAVVPGVSTPTCNKGGCYLWHPRGGPF